VRDKHEERLAHLLFTPELPKSIDLRSAGISVLHHRPNDRSGMDITILPLENVAGAPPTDVVFGFPEFQANLNRIAELIDLIGEGRIPTDGSEERVGRCKVNGTETFSVHPRAEKTMSGYIHDDFSGYQQGMKASHQEGTVFRFRRAN
jgi:hypothetical protein